MGKFLVFSFTTASFFYLYNKIKEYFKTKKNKMLLKEAQERKRNLYLKSIQKYDAIKNYSICLSIDYKTKRNFSKEDKKVVNKVIFLKMQELLKRKFVGVEIYVVDDVLISVSSDFYAYDNIYDEIIRMLSKIKSEVDERYCVYMIPSITIDAYRMIPSMQDIRTDHDNIKHCSLNNMVCSTKIFGEKYKSLNKNKYLGNPIGE